MWRRVPSAKAFQSERFRKASVEEGVEADRPHQRVRGTGAGVRLIAQPRLAEEGPLGDARAPLDLRQEGPYPEGHLGGHVRPRDSGLEILLGHRVGAQAEIQDAEFEPDPGQVGVVEDDAFERADGRLEIPDLSGDFGKAEVGVEVSPAARGCA
jgi:hypothetical protein